MPREASMSTDINSLTIAYSIAKGLREDAKAIEKEAAAVLAKIEADLFDALENAGLRSVKID